MLILNIAKHYDSRAPLEYLRGLAFYYDIQQIKVLSMFLSIFIIHACQSLHWRQNSSAPNGRR